MKEHRSIKHGPWIWMSKAAINRAREAAGGEGIRIYMALCVLESNAPKEAKGRFFASRINIAEQSGCGIRTITRYLPILEKAGLFQMASGKSKTEGRPHEANRFTLYDVGPSGHRAMAPESCDSGQQKRSFSRREKETSSEAKETGSAKAPHADAGSQGQPVKEELPMVAS